MEKAEATALFAQQRGAALSSILGSIEQTFGGEPLYQSVETRAAHLLYFIILVEANVDFARTPVVSLFVRCRWPACMSTMR